MGTKAGFEGAAKTARDARLAPMPFRELPRSRGCQVGRGQEAARRIGFSSGHHLQQPPALGLNLSPPDPAGCRDPLSHRDILQRRLAGHCRLPLDQERHYNKTEVQIGFESLLLAVENLFFKPFMRVRWKEVAAGGSEMLLVVARQRLSIR